MITTHWLNGATLEKGDLDLLRQWQQSPTGTIWLDIFNESPDTEKQLLTELGCHPLAIQDMQRERHPPKLEHFDDNTFILYRGIKAMNGSLNIELSPIAFFINNKILITCHRHDSIGIDTIMQKKLLPTLLTTPVKLCCSIINASALNFTNTLLEFEETLTELEEKIANNGSDELLMDVTLYRTRLRKLRRVFGYHERMFHQLLAESKSIADEDTQNQINPDNNSAIIHSIQDVYDKFERLLSLSNLYYDLCGDISDGYLSLASHRLNRTMQVLTVITAIFIPLGFLAGIYGMNFEVMPELHYRYAYPTLIFFMVTIAISLIIIFRRKKWL